MHKKIFSLLTKIIFGMLSFSAFSTPLPAQNPVPGGIILIAIENSDKPAPHLFFNKKRVLVVKNDNKWIAIVGIPLSSKPGGKQLLPSAQGAKYSFVVTPKEYPSQYITLKNKRMVNPNPGDLKRIKRERLLLNNSLSTWTESKEVETNFKLPAKGRLSSPFGLRRFFNNQPRNPHSGLDIAAAAGTPITAPASGKVINTGDYYFNGNTVLLDHGQGLITGYFHMQKIDVKQGQIIKQGDILGRIGRTGRATGPHLHWNVYLNKTKVDPALFVAKQLKQK